MVINQGDVYWLYLREPSGSEPGYKHPHMVVQNNLFNRSQIGTVLVCALTSNLKRANAPGNVLLAQGEANLPKPSVANVSQLLTVDKSQWVNISAHYHPSGYGRCWTASSCSWSRAK